MSTQQNETYTYEVALSFAGENRAMADEIARLLRAHSIAVFYDTDEEANLWGKNLIDHLTDVYGKQSRHCMMLISQHYVRKEWTNHERQTAQARVLRGHPEYILPVRLDDTEVPGLLASIGYLDLRKMSVATLVERTVEKLRQATPQSKAVEEPSFPVQPGRQAAYAIPLPQMKPTFTQREKDKFLAATFVVIKDYFREGLAALDASNREIETDFVEVNAQRCTCKIYFRGEIKRQCRIWLEDSMCSTAINYGTGVSLGMGSESYNEWLRVDDSGDELLVRPGGMPMLPEAPKEPVSQEKAAEYLWRVFTSHLFS